MARPTKAETALLAFQMAERQRLLDRRRFGWRVCPATQDFHHSRQLACSDCMDGTCARMKAKGLDDAGAALPQRDRPACGAKTRSGQTCKNKVVPGKCRCKHHGGKSTGPKSPEGKARIAKAQKKRWATWRKGKPEV